MARLDRGPALALAAWAAIALLLASSGLVSPERLPIVPVAIASLTAISAIAYLRIERVRAFARAIDLRIPIAYHLIRIPFGAAFVVMGAEGTLDPTFAGRAGWGDLLAGALALIAVVAITVRPPARLAIWIFNVVGLLDMLVVIATANWVLFFSGRPQGMYALAELPFSTIPFFVVPLILATHLLIFARLRAPATGSRTP